jgi:integrase
LRATREGKKTSYNNSLARSASRLYNARRRLASKRTPTSVEQHLPVELSQITAYAWELKKNGRTDSTIETITHRLLLLAKHCNINEPESVKEALATLKWENSTKHTAVSDYTGYLKYIGKTWTKPRYIIQEKIYFIPTEQEIDSLISASGRTLAPLLQFLKETATRIGEAIAVTWMDIDTNNKTVAINHPEKGSLPRLIPISSKLLTMLNTLPKTEKPIFLATSSKHGLRITFEDMRKRTAEKLSNPRLMKIHFHTFRHWKATTEFLKLKDGYYVRALLGHKTATMTDRYINIAKALLHHQEDGYTAKVAQTKEEICELIEAGFEHHDDIDGLHIYRKRK